MSRIYIASCYSHIDVKRKVDNDPHFWSSPPTWGICRLDFLCNVKKGDYIFYVFPQNYCEFPQMIFGYIEVEEIITHEEAYKRYPLKRIVAYRKPQGNILVDENGKYNYLDYGHHKNKFETRKNYYVVGSKNSKLLSEEEILNKCNEFPKILFKMFQSNLIGRKGRVLNDVQVSILLNWLNMR